MYHLFNVLFDDSTKEEKIFFYKLIKDQNTKEYTSILITDYATKTIGSFLFDFINQNFSCKETFCKFVSIIVLKLYIIFIFLIEYVILIIHL